ncbi:hypothetical protein AAHH67_26260 [Niallia circulans]
MADFRQLKSALKLIKEKETKLDALFNNAGGSFSKLVFSPQGRELHYEIQTVVPFIITMELLDLLKKESLLLLYKLVQMHLNLKNLSYQRNWQTRLNFRN